MATTRLFGNKIVPACKYCENARTGVMRDGRVLCGLKGVVRADFNCRRYAYDPLRRVPANPAGPGYESSDFEI